MHKASNNRVLILGITFKENCNDIRNSMVFSIFEQLKKRKIEFDVFDPWVDIKV